MSLVLAAGAAMAATIEEDTVWQGQVRVTEDTRVAQGATLLLLPGTRVRFGGEGSRPVRLVVQGRLVAQGRPGEPVVFTSAAAKPQAGDWGGIFLDRARAMPSRLEWCRVEYAVEGLRAASSSLLVSDTHLVHNQTGFMGIRTLVGWLFRCRVAENLTGLRFESCSGLLAEACRVEDNTRTGFLFTIGSAAVVRNCEVVRNGKIGIACLRGSSPTLQGNLISRHERGVYVEFQSRPQITGNRVADNATGIWAERRVFPAITRNRVAGNGVGIYLNYSAYPELHGNDLVDNSEAALRLGEYQSIQGEKFIPYRAQGQIFAETPPDEKLPPQSRKSSPVPASDAGIVDARGNWWGPETTAQMVRLGPGGNIAAIEDAHDRSHVLVLGTRQPRDRVLFAPWEEHPVPGADRPDLLYAGVKGRVLLGDEPVAEARVHAYVDSQSEFRGEGFAFSAPTGADGSFTLHLAPGRYFLAAKKGSSPLPGTEPGAGGLWGHPAENPVVVPPGRYVDTDLPVKPLSSGPRE